MTRSHVFPRFASATCKYFGFWLAHWIALVICDCLEWLLWFWFYETQLKTPLLITQPQFRSHCMRTSSLRQEKCPRHSMRGCKERQKEEHRLYVCWTVKDCAKVRKSSPFILPIAARGQSFSYLIFSPKKLFAASLLFSFDSVQKRVTLFMKDS